MDLNLSDYIKHPEKLDKETLPRLEKLVHAIDPDCFLIVSQVTEVRGRGFSMDKKYQLCVLDIFPILHILKSG